MKARHNDRFDAAMREKRQRHETRDTSFMASGISATVSEAVAQAFENTKDLPEEVSRVTLRDIAGARFVPQSDARVVESMRLAA
jgi:hypothetical protein